MDILYVGLGNAVAAALLALPAAAAGRLCRGRPALVRSLWLLVLLRLLAPPLVCPRVAWPWPTAHADPAAPAAHAVETPPPASPGPGPEAGSDPVGLLPDEPAGVAPADLEASSSLPPAAPPATAPAEPPAAPPLPAPTWQQAALSFWLAGSCVWWFIAARRLYRFGRVARHAHPAPAVEQEMADRLSRRLGMRRCPPVRFVPGQVPPLLWGVVGPARVLLPAALWERLTPGQQETLLAHELAHLRRGDHWVRRLELVVLGLYWWHPVAWWARRQIQEAEEQCCDAWVVGTLPEAAADYARALLTTIAFLADTRAALPVGASGVGQVPVLKRRLAMILQGTTPRGLSRAGLAAVLGLGAVLLPLLPSWGQAQSAGEKPAPIRVTAPASDTPNTPLSGARDAPGGATTESAPEAPAPRHSTRTVTASEEQPDGAVTAEDQTELLKAQLDVRKAEAEETRALLDQARRQAARVEELAKRGAAGNDAVDQARTDVTVLEARLRGKLARVREAEIQLKQAARSHAPPRAPQPSPNQPAAGSSEAPLPPLGQPIKPSSTSAAPVAPGPVLHNTHRSGENTEQRLRELEKKIDGLLREVEALRREMHPKAGSPDARPGAPPATGRPFDPFSAPPASPGR